MTGDKNNVKNRQKSSAGYTAATYWTLDKAGLIGE